MNKSIKLFLLSLAVVFMILQLSKLSIPSYLQHKQTVDENGSIACLFKALPQDADVLLFTEPDGTIDSTRYGEEAGFLTYELVPRVLTTFKSAPVKIEDYTWLIANNLPAVELDTFNKQYPVEITQTCDQYVVLRKIP